LNRDLPRKTTLIKDMARLHTHYDNLKGTRNASTEMIRAAYKKLLQKYHPDRNPGDSEAARIMRIINSSYGVLADPIKRQKHDLWIAAQEKTHPSVASRSKEFKGSKAATSPAAVGFKEKLIRGIRKITFHMAPR
jgi:DnaJ-class molecular chaperone